MGCMGTLEMVAGKFNLSMRGGRLKVSSSLSESIVYLFDLTSPILYALTRQEIIDKREIFQVSTFVCPSPISDVHSFKDFDYCFCKDGALYAIPRNTIESGSEETQLMTGYADDLTCLATNSVLSNPWDIIQIDGTRRVFADKTCHHIFLFRDGLINLVQNESHWRVNIHETKPGSTKTIFQRQPSLSIDLPCISAKDGGARVVACFQTCSRVEPNFVEPVLLESLFGRELSVQRGHLAFVVTDAGEVFYAFWTLSESSWNRSGPLFCLHQPVLDIWIPRFGEGSARIPHGIVFIGRLGKVVIFSSRHDCSDGYSISEYHVPSPVLCSTALHLTMIHSDGSCLWKSVLQSTSKENGVDLELNTSSLEIADVTQAQVFNSKDAVILTEDGRVLVKRDMESWQSESVFPGNPPQVSSNCSLEDLLDKIKASSERLAATCDAQEQQKRILRSLSTAAHVALNEKVRNTFRLQLSCQWTSDDPRAIAFNVKLSNTKNYVLSEDEWHIVINVSSAAGLRHTKTVPIVGGPITEKGISLTTKPKFPESLLLCEHFPLTVSCGLQFAQRQPDFNVIRASVRRGLSDTGRLAFVVPLISFVVDELTFLRQQSNVAKLTRPQRQTDKSVADALIDMSETRRARLGLPATVTRRKIHPALAPTGNSVTLNLSSVHQFLSCDGSVSEADLLGKLLAHITQECENIDLTSLAESTLTATIFNNDVTINAMVDGSLAKVVVKSTCPTLAVGVRRAVLRRLKLCVKSPSKPSKDCEEQISFVVPKSVLQHYKSLHEHLDVPESINQMELPEIETEQMTHRLYWQTRDSLSCRLPFL